MTSTLSKEEQMILNREQLEIWTQKLYDEVFTKKDSYPDNITFIEQYSSSCWQYAKVLQKQLRLKPEPDEDEEAGGEKQV